MPWLSFSNLTDEDAHAIAAYLKSLRPVRHRVPDPLEPGAKLEGSVHVFPPPSEWDVPPAPAATGR